MRQRLFIAELSQYPFQQKFNFSKTEAEREIVKAYKEQLGKTKRHKFTTYLKAAY